MCGSGCGLCIYTSDLWSQGYICKHSNFSASAAFHFKASVCLGMPTGNTVVDFAASSKANFQSFGGEDGEF